jgi:hypothetical protein
MGGFQNSLLRKIRGPKMEEITGDCIKVHSVEFNDFYSSPKIIRVIKPRTIWEGGNLAGEMFTRFCWRNFRKREGL